MFLSFILFNINNLHIIKILNLNKNILGYDSEGEPHTLNLSPDGNLVEFVELPQSVHPYYVGTQAHPEFLSRPTAAHLLFSGLIAAAIKKNGK